MFILYFAACSSFWFQCTRSGEMLEPGRWQSAHWLFAIVFGSAPLLNVVWLATQSEPAPLAWHVRQACWLGFVFQLSPCGVAGLSPEWHLVQLRRSCGNPTSAYEWRLLRKPQMT